MIEDSFMKSRLPAGAGTNTKNNGGGSLLEGNYDEAQSHQEFLDALNAWRTGGQVRQSNAVGRKGTTGDRVRLYSYSINLIESEIQ
jgi:hypothetical protein